MDTNGVELDMDTLRKKLDSYKSVYPRMHMEFAFSHRDIAAMLDEIDALRARVAAAERQIEFAQVCVANGHHELYYSPDGGFCRQCGWKRKTAPTGDGEAT